MKLPFSFSLKFAFRLLLPGFILSLGTYPILQTIIEKLSLTVTSEFTFLLSIVVFGWLFIIFDMPIYMAFEGRRYWPKFLWNHFKRLEEKRLKRTIKDTESLDARKYLEASVELRLFPMGSDGNYYVKFPTRIGNLIAAYEMYPERSYGMDSIFYWYRIWLSLDKDLREEIDNQQAIADSSVYVIAALNICGVLCLIYSLLQIINNQLIKVLPNEYLLLGLAILAFIVSYVIYRFSLHIHATFGEIFKSIFDNYRKNISVDDLIDEVSRIKRDSTLANLSEKEKYKIAWRYLHNYRVKTNGRVLRPSEINPPRT